MKTLAVAAFSLVMVTLSKPVFPQASQVSARDFLPLISKARGAIRSRIERGTGCLPWVVLAKDPNNAETFKDYGISRAMTEKIDASPAGLGKLFSRAAREGGYEFSAIGTCELDASRVASDGHNVISLILERRDWRAIRIRFPYERDANGQVVYLQDQVSGEPSASMIFSPPSD